MEKRETITLDARAQQRLAVLNHVLSGELSPAEAAAYVRLSSRQLRRLLKAYRRDGVAALVHGNNGRRPVNRLGDVKRDDLAELAQTTYAGFNPVHLAETLAEERPELAVSPRTLRRVLAEAGIAPVRTRRAPRHRSRRERMPRAGMLLQADGSRHDWLEGRGPWLTLVGSIDDATGNITGATFREQEDAAGYFTVLAQTVRRHGLPLALYTDRHGIFWRDPRRPPTLAEELTGKRSLTQVGRALDELGVEWIAANSAPAKGRIERGWGTLQDRLASDLRRARAASLVEANAVLARHLPRHNARFAVPPADHESAWRPWPLAIPPEAVLCFCYARKVARDATLAWNGTALAIPRRRDGRSWADRQVIVEEHLDGSLWVRDQSERHRLAEAPPSAPVLRARQLRRLLELPTPAAPQTPVARQLPRPRPKTPWKPPPDHPWRR